MQHYQHKFKINVWAWIIDGFIIGPVKFLPNLFDEPPLAIKQNMQFMHDRPSPQFTLKIGNNLNQNGTAEEEMFL